MASENRIVVGCRVQAKVGPFIQDERSSFVSSDSCEEPSSKRRSFRRTRRVFTERGMKFTAMRYVPRSDAIILFLDFCCKRDCTLLPESDFCATPFLGALPFYKIQLPLLFLKTARYKWLFNF